MTKKRYEEIWEHGKIIGTKDTKNHVSMNIKTMIRELNSQDERIKELTTQLQIEEESICIKCKHHYLIKYPDESSKYYISKCKKEHDECSKEDIRYCEDFELKGDKE